MDLFLLTISWMLFNLALAVIPVITGLGFIKTKSRTLQILFGILWIIFLPNTVYLLTDVFHLLDDWTKTPFFFNLIIIPMYILIVLAGIVTFVFSLYPFEKAVKNLFKTHATHLGAILFINVLIAIGITLGRIERINSWEAITDIPKVSAALVAIITSAQLFFVTILFGMTTNLLYFTVKENEFLKRKYKRILSLFPQSL